MHISATLGPAGPVISVGVAVSLPRQAALKAANMLVPPMVMAPLLIDTGASHTTICKSVIQQLGLQATGSVQVHTPSTGNTPHACSQYDLAMMFVGSGRPHIIPGLPVTEADFTAQLGMSGLIGRDILLQGRLTYSGPDSSIMLSF